ncbi:ABC transporter permease [Paenibacillus montaniterrae]|uniref:ABC transporter permease n=1 Tax=Paenibacillus montaniterrae TaxID=429341 RepID=A0A919YP20_9BACL|nr:ABC transporter permease [Paenibacillus montaniterrae]GIP15661.1 ABC transporter permease [Paenibacillus montaniterrae]
MTFRSLALKNIKENWRSYSAFFFSSLFSVAIFYIYYAFVVHPDVINGNLVAAGKVKLGLEYCLYLISIFSFIFILYSSGSFLKSRKKEFGLFSLFGMTRRQLRKLVFVENMLIGLLSTVAGIGIGILFSKLFLMGLGALLKVEEQIRFVVPLKAVSLTLIVFIGIFLVITLYITLRIGKGQIIELLQAHKQPKGELRFSKFKVIIGAISLLIGYALAATMTMMTFLLTSLPIIGFVVLGTYLLYTQLSVVILNFLKRRHKLYYKKSNMLIISQLGYKIRDNARVLFTITILSAVVMTAMGTIYVLQNMIKQQLLATPYSVAWIETADENVAQLDRAKLDELIAKHGLQISKEEQIAGLKLEQYNISYDQSNRSFGKGEQSTMIIPLSVYNENRIDGKELKLANDEAALVEIFMDNYKKRTGTVTGKVGNADVELKLVDVTVERFMNIIYDWNSMPIIVTDERYEQLLAQGDETSAFTLHGIEFSNWKSSVPMLKELRSSVSDETVGSIDYYRNIDYEEIMQSTSLTIFVGLFVCLLFFVAAGSLIYFKLFTERDEDVSMFKGLSRIGITFKEMRKVIVTQVAIIFFLPCLVGIMHALFAMLALNRLLNGSGWIYAFVVFGIYVAMQAIYFLIASRSYLHSIRKGAATAAM